MFSLDGYQAVTANGGVVRRADRGVLAVAGADRATWLQGLLTNDVASLKDGESRYAAYLTPQGRMITDMNVVGARRPAAAGRAGDRWPRRCATGSTALIFSEDAQVTDESGRCSVWTVIGTDELVDVDRRNAAGRVRVAAPSRSRHLRSDPHRARRAEVPRRHGRRHDPARSRHRGSRHLVHEGLLRRAGSDRPRHALAAAAASRRSWCDGSPTLRAEIVPLPDVADLLVRQGHRPRHQRRVLADVNRVVGLGYVHRDFIAAGTEVTVVWNDARIKAVVQ